jgi:hypothetical protein
MGLLDLAAYSYRRLAPPPALAPPAFPTAAGDPEEGPRAELRLLLQQSITQEKRIIARNLLPGQNLLDQPCESLEIAMNPLETVSERCEDLRLFMDRMSGWELEHDGFVRQLQGGPYGWTGPVPSGGRIRIPG